jgi:hypothetical protein
MQMKMLLLAVAVLSIVEIVPCSVYADIIGTTASKPQAVYADPSDVVVQANDVGPCGSHFFHIQRRHANFKELTAVALTALSTGKNMAFFVESCSPATPGPDSRNILSHGAVTN